MQPPYQQPPYKYTNTTKYPGSLGPTQAAHSSNYETTEQAYLNPYLNDQYQDVPPIPPPPPKHKSYRWLYILLLAVVAITPVTLYRIVTTAPVTTAPVITKTNVVTPTPYPTFNATDMILSLTKASGMKIWKCTLVSIDPSQNLITTAITLYNQMLDTAAYECERAENAFPNVGAPLMDASSISYYHTECKGVTKDHTNWSVTADYYNPDILPECRVLASW